MFSWERQTGKDEIDVAKVEPTRGLSQHEESDMIFWRVGEDTDVTFPEASMEGVGRDKKFETCPA